MLLRSTEDKHTNTIKLPFKRQKTSRKHIKQYNEAVEQGVVNNTTNKRMKDLENQIEDLERQILVEKSKTILKLSKEDIKEYYIQALQLEHKLLIDYLIQEIKAFEEKIEIIFNSPVKTRPDKNQGFFYSHSFQNFHNTFKIKNSQI